MLSQSTNDRNRDVAYLALRERFPTWEEVRDAPVDALEEAIRPGGISKVKSARIKSILVAITETAPERAHSPEVRADPLSLDWLPELTVPEAWPVVEGGVRPSRDVSDGRVTVTSEG